MITINAILNFIVLQIGNGRSVSQVLEQQSQEIKNIVVIITNVGYMVAGALAIISAIMIFTTDGDGAEKMKKSGGWIYTTVFVGIASMIARALFG